MTRTESLIQAIAELREELGLPPQPMEPLKGGWVLYGQRTVRPSYLEDVVHALKARKVRTQAEGVRAREEAAERSYWECRGVTTGVPLVPQQYA